MTDSQLMFVSLVHFILNLQLILDRSYETSLNLCEKYSWNVVTLLHTKVAQSSEWKIELPIASQQNSGQDR